MKRNFYTVIQLSKNMYKDNDGTLVCKNAVLGKVGTQAYSARELGLDSSEVVLIHRPEEEVFDEQSLTSLKGKALTLLHPEEDVTLDNYSKLAKGIVMDVRKEGNLMIGDIRVFDKEVIELITSKKMVELSLGYDTKLKYEEGNKLKQTEIVYNHVALVPKGRAEVARVIDQMQGEHQIRDKQLEMEVPMEKKDTGLITKVLESLGLKKRSLDDGVEVYELPTELVDNEIVEQETQEEVVVENNKEEKQVDNPEEVTVQDTETEDTVEEEITQEEPEVTQEETTEETLHDEEEIVEETIEGEKVMDKFDELIAKANKLNEIQDEDLRKTLKDQLLAEFAPKQEESQKDNSALEAFGNISFEDSDIEKFDFNGEFEKMLNDVNPENYDTYADYVKARKKISKETTEAELQKLADGIFEGGNA